MRRRGDSKGQYIPNGVKAIIFIFPSFIGVIIFSLFPLINVIKNSFFNSFTGEWVGIENYKLVLNNFAFQLAIKNMVIFMVLSIPLLCVMSLVFAWWIENIDLMKNFIKTSFLIPMILPVSAVVLLCQITFDSNGFLNRITQTNGIDWINSSYAIYALVGIYVWKNIGYTILLWCAALEQIPMEVYEVAALDGANKMQQFCFITIPHIKPSGFIIVVISIVNSFKVFRESYLLSGNYPHESIYMTQNIFNNWFIELAIDKISAGAMMIVIVIAIFVWGLERYWEKGGKI